MSKHNTRIRLDNDKATYVNVKEQDPDYENAAPTGRHYSRQLLDLSRHNATAETADERRNSDSSSDKMVFVQPIAHISSEANKLVVNKVEKIQMSKPGDESCASQSHTNDIDVLYKSKQATVKELPSTSSTRSQSTSVGSTMATTDNHYDSDSSDQLVTFVMKRTSPQRAIIRQPSKESDVQPAELASSDVPRNAGSNHETKEATPVYTHSANISGQAALTAGQYLMTQHGRRGQTEVETVEVNNGHELSSDSMSDAKHSSHSSSLASLSNVVAPCGSTEDLDQDSEQFPLIPDSPELNHKAGKTTKSDVVDIEAPLSSVLSTNDKDETSDFVRDITMSLAEALESMDKVMSRGATTTVSNMLSKPDVTANSKTGNIKTADTKLADSKPTNSKPANIKPEEPTKPSETCTVLVTNPPAHPKTESCSSNEGVNSRAHTGSSSVLSFNEGRIAFNFNDDGSILSKVILIAGSCCLIYSYFFTS